MSKLSISIILCILLSCLHWLILLINVLRNTILKPSAFHSQFNSNADIDIITIIFLSVYQIQTIRQTSAQVAIVGVLPSYDVTTHLGVSYSIQTISDQHVWIISQPVFSTTSE